MSRPPRLGPRRRLVAGLLCAALVVIVARSTRSAVAESPSPPRSFRLIAFDYKQRLSDTRSYRTYHANLEAQIGAARDEFATGRPTLAFLPEDTGLLSWFVGPRGLVGRQVAELAQNSTAAVAALAATYAPQVAYYEAKCGPIPPARALGLALTDTAWRAFGEKLAELAQRWGIWIIANLNAPDIRVIRNPVKVLALGDPLMRSKGYAYEGGCRLWNTAYLFSPGGHLDRDGAANPSSVLAGRQKKVYLVPTERAQLVGLAMNSESPAAARTIETPFGGLGVLTSKDAWMSDVVERLAIDGMEVFLQPEAGAWAGHDEESGANWPPDVMTRAVWSMVQWQSETTWGGLADLTGNFGDLYFDGTATVTRDTLPGEVPATYLLGRMPQAGIVARAPWVFADPPPGVALANLESRRKILDRQGARLTPGSGDPLENGQLANFVAADVVLRPIPSAGPRVPAAFGASTPVAEGRGAQWAPSLAAGPDERIHVSWTDLRAGFESPYVSASSDGGASWGPAVKAGDSTARPFDQQDNQYDAKLAVAADGSVHLVWLDFRNQSWDVYAARSATGGAGWSPSRRVDHSPTSDEGFPLENVDQDPTLVSLPDGSLVAAWSDARGRRVDRGIVSARSDDGGRTWQGDVDVDGTGALEADQWSPALAAAPSGELVAAWQDHRTGWNQVWAATSGDGGLTWNQPFRVDPRTNDQWEPSVAVGATGEVVVAWSEAEGSGGRRVRLSTFSVDDLGPGGIPNLVSTIDVDPSASAGNRQSRPAVTFAGDRLLVVWQDDRGGDWDVLLSSISTDLTRTLVRVDDGSAGADAQLPTIAVLGDRLFVAWEDTRSGIEQIRVASAMAASP